MGMIGDKGGNLKYYSLKKARGFQSWKKTTEGKDYLFLQGLDEYFAKREITDNGYKPGHKYASWGMYGRELDGDMRAIEDREEIVKEDLKNIESLLNEE